ncbi:MAG: PIG-L family deacetylase [Cyclobacteriaceae bacterium]|nr:PIG-L family deacetylase [Cyclobacteriaceae bacterium]
MIRNFILFISLILIACQHDAQHQSKTILVVLAHPDDETAFGSALAKHARLGDRVHLILAVDAKFDTRFVNASPDSVAQAKQRDVVCSCEKLSIEKPIFYSFNSMDRKHGTKDGVRDAVETGNQFREKLKQSIVDLEPDLIITFGPDGEYGHPEHIIVSSLVTELLLREGWVDQYPLYYFGWTRSLEADGDGWVRYADDQYFNVETTYTDEDEQRAAQAIRCYTSGFSTAEMEEMIAFEKGRENKLYFRKFATEIELQKEF